MRSVLPWRIQRLTDDGEQALDGGVVVEEPLEIRLNGEAIAILMRTPGMEKELAVGYCLGEGIVADMQHIALVRHCGRSAPDATASAEELDDSRNRVDVRLMPGHAVGRPMAVFRLIRSGCGQADVSTLTENLTPVAGGMSVSREVLSHVVAQITRQQSAYRAVGGVHAAALFDARGQAVVVCEDIGRHNAVDKAMGYCLLRGIPLQDKILVSTGRASYDMVAKSARLGVPILASLSSPTSLAVELAQALNCTLIGYLRGKTLNVYAHGWRVIREGSGDHRCDVSR